MSLEKIINTLKVPKEEMSAISFNIPMRLKNQLTKLAKKNDFTVNSFLVAMIDDVLNGELKERKNLEIVEKLDSLLERKIALESWEHTLLPNGDLPNHPSSAEHEELKEIKYMIKLLKDIK